ncbi:MAG: GNAT family N-acetyltransferase [Synergistales bacterium]|nr:GNAT family N-acetyltransferase [Synergistales bacterium]
MAGNGNGTAAFGGVTIRTTIEPGDLGAVVWLHGVLYAEEYGFDATFEPYVAEPMAHFVLNRNRCDRIWIVATDQGVRGSVAIVDGGDGAAQLRWFLLHPKVRGRGLGKHLIGESVCFCRQEGYGRIFLWTVRELDAAIHIYRRYGFRRTDVIEHEHWGRHIVEERYDLEL